MTARNVNPSRDGSPVGFRRSRRVWPSAPGANRSGTCTGLSPATLVAARYGYDPMHRRIWKEQFKTASGQSTLAYYHHDHLNTPIAASDKAGNVVWAAYYDPFGQASIITTAATASAPTISSNLRLPGQYWDAESGLHYNWHRYYEPGVGRYTQRDPIGCWAHGGQHLQLCRWVLLF